MRRCASRWRLQRQLTTSLSDFLARQVFDRVPLGVVDTGWASRIDGRAEQCTDTYVEAKRRLYLGANYRVYRTIGSNIRVLPQDICKLGHLKASRSLELRPVISHNGQSRRTWRRKTGEVFVFQYTMKRQIWELNIVSLNSIY